MNSKISIIIINWNGWKDTLECLESLYQIDYPNYNVILVDNNSKDYSVEKIEEYCQGKIEVNSPFFVHSTKNKPIKIFKYNENELNDGLRIKKNEKEIYSMQSNKKLILIENSVNLGFSGGNNIGLKYALKNLKSDYILLLNNDTVVDTDFLTEMLEVANSNNQIGFLGPKTYYYTDKNIICFAGGLLNMSKGKPHAIGVNEVDNHQYNKIRNVDYVEGSCLLVKKEVLDKIGLFDTKYFAYWEETDLCKRGSKVGYHAVYVPRAKIWHKVSASFNSPLKLYYYTRNKIWFMKKNATRKEYLSFILYFFGYLFWRRNFDCFYSSLRNKKNFEKMRNFSKGAVEGLIYGKKVKE